MARAGSVTLRGAVFAVAVTCGAGMSSSSQAACPDAQSLVFECVIARNLETVGKADQAGKSVSICLAGETAVYQFGPPGQKPELELKAPLGSSDLEVMLWSGVGRYINESVTFRSGAYSYTAGYGMDRLDPSCETECDVNAGLRVMKGEKQLAALACHADTLEQAIHILSPVVPTGAAEAATAASGITATSEGSLVGNAEAPSDCGEGTASGDLIACAKRDLSAAKTKMRGSVAKLSKNTDDDGRERLNAAQDAWRKFRKLECRRLSGMTPDANTATLRSLECRTTLTNTRAEELLKGSNGN